MKSSEGPVAGSGAVPPLGIAGAGDFEGTAGDGDGDAFGFCDGVTRELTEGDVEGLGEADCVGFFSEGADATGEGDGCLEDLFCTV